MDGTLIIFNVDHGACALLTMSNGQPGGVHRILIDCGHSTDYQGRPWHPGDWLKEHGISFIDLLICTNYDEDREWRSQSDRERRERRLHPGQSYGSS